MGKKWVSAAFARRVLKFNEGDEWLLKATDWQMKIVIKEDVVKVNMQIIAIIVSI